MFTCVLWECVYNEIYDGKTYYGLRTGIHSYLTLPTFIHRYNAKINISWQVLEMSYLLFKMPNKNCRHTLAIFLLNPT